MTTLATSDLSLSAIQAILSDSGDASLYDMCNHANVDPMGLSETYCAGGGVTARHTTLKGPPCKMGNFRGYAAPNNAIFCLDMEDIVLYRSASGQVLHPSKTWSFGFQYYTGGAYTTTVFNQTTRLCYTPVITDYAIDFGAENATLTGPHGAGSPVWYRRFTDEDGLMTVSAGTYYWVLLVGSDIGFLSDDYGEGGEYIVQAEVYDYLLSDPDEFLSFSSGGGIDDFDVWTGLYSSSQVISGSVSLTGATNGTGNRTQSFSVPPNTTGYPITHHIMTTASGVTSSHVYIYQDA